jgi:hypothetical protein
MTPEQRLKNKERQDRYKEKNAEAIKAAKKANYEKNKDFYVEYERNRQYIKTYGITVDDYNRMFEEQGGKCKICGTEEPKSRGNKHFAVDHCHTTGQVRGLLCNVCNIAVGFYEKHSNKVVEYLREFK